jgi:hypothetical protein
MTTTGGFDVRATTQPPNPEGIKALMTQMKQATQSRASRRSLKPTVVETEQFKAILSRPEIAAAIQENPEILSAVDSYGYTLLWYAAVGQPNPKHVKVLIKAGVKVDQPIEAGSTVFMSAVFNGHLKIAEQLREAGANINYKNKNGHCALTMAIRSGNPKPVQYLLSLEGIQLAPKDKFDKYPIQYFNIQSTNTHRNLLARALYKMNTDDTKDALERYIRAVGLSYIQHTDSELYTIVTKELGYVPSEMRAKR